MAVKPAQKKNPAAVALGRLGGRKGGKRSLETMTDEERAERARKASEARWAKEPIGPERAKRARKAAMARWGKHRKK